MGTYTKACSLIAAAGLWLLASSFVQAQQPNPEDIDELVVTGSFLNRSADRPMPVTILGGADIANEMKGSTAEVLADLSSNQGAIINMSAGPVSGQAPAAQVNLRGVGPRGTLVLLNGRRVTEDAVGDGNGNVAVDVNRLTPQIMIERVEILKDGASATYGADAVAGVVNFITRNQFEGFAFELDNRRFDRTDQDEYSLGLMMGMGNNDTHLVGAFEYSSTPSVNAQDVFSLDRILTVATISSFGNPGSFSDDAPGSPIPSRTPDPLCEDESVGGLGFGGVQSTDVCGLALGLTRAVVAGSERYVGLVNMDHAFSDDLNLNLEFGFAQESKTRDNYGFPIFARPFVGPGNPGFDDAIANGFRLRNDPTGVNTADGVRMWYRPGNPAQVLKVNQYDISQFHVSGTMDGQFNADWGWQIEAAYSDLENRNVTTDVILSNFEDALACQGGIDRNLCYNPFGSALAAAPGSPLANSPEVVNWVNGDRILAADASLTTLQGLVRGSFGDIGGEPVQIAIGYQSRYKTFSQDFDSISNSGGFAFFSAPFLDFDGARGVDSYFTELGIYPTADLEVQLAGRYESYDNGLNTFDPKISALWTPRDDLFLRASWGTSFRAPGELQTFGQTVGALEGDFAGSNLDVRAVTAGNVNLDAEEATTFTVGATWDVTEAFTVDLNYFSIEFENLIQEQDAYLILLEDIQDGTVDDPIFTLCPGSTNVVANMVAQDFCQVNISFVNQEALKVSGLDFELDYDLTTDIGQFGARLAGTYYSSYELALDSGTVDGVGSMNSTNFGVPLPEYQASLRGDWRNDNHYVRVTVRSMPAVEEDLTPNVTEEVSFTTVDLLYQYELQLSGDDSPYILSAGFTNLFDETAPAKDDSLPTYAGQLHDPRGRLFNLRVSKEF